MKTIFDLHGFTMMRDIPEEQIGRSIRICLYQDDMFLDSARLKGAMIVPKKNEDLKVIEFSYQKKGKICDEIVAYYKATSYLLEQFT